MRKILIAFFSILICTNISLADTIIYEKPDVKIIVEGQYLELGTEVPIIINSRTLVPLRKLLVGLGVPDNTENIQWIGDTREVKVIYNGVNINLAIDNSKAYINGQEYVLDSAPVIYKDRTYLPARFVGEALGYTISWDQYTPAVLVTSNENMNKLTEIVNDLNTAMDSVKSYEVIISKRSNLKNKFSQDESEYEKSIIERADLRKGIVYTEESFSSSYNNDYSFCYNTKDCVLENYKYIVDDEIYELGWSKDEYVPEVGSETPFDSKEKMGIVKIDKNFVGSLLFEEKQDTYLVGTISNQIDVAKGLGIKEIYDNIVQSEKVQDFRFLITIDKNTKLPQNMIVVYEVSLDDENTEKAEYIFEFLPYNQEMNIQLPNV